MAETRPDARASKIRRFGPLASAANRNVQRNDLKGCLDRSSNPGQHQPALSTEVQRSLLHVGMKVRKSVLNGYKTGLEALEQALDAAATHDATIDTGVPTTSFNSARTPNTLAASVLKWDRSGSNEFIHQRHGFGARRKRSFEAETETPPTPLDTDMVIDSDKAQMPNKHEGKVRRFAIPRSRRVNSLAVQPMDLDPFIYTDEQGDFGEADFLVPE